MLSRMPHARCRLGLSAVVVLWACSSASDERPAPEANAARDSSTSAEAAPAASAGVKACDLVNTPDLERIVGIELQPARTTNDYLGVSQCRWDRATGGEGGISIALHEHGDIENYRKVPGSSPVTGVGDEAVWNADTNQLGFRKDAAVISISFLFSPSRLQWAREIARLALLRVSDTTLPAQRP
jgi:hypothetical protein